MAKEWKTITLSLPDNLQGVCAWPENKPKTEQVVEHNAKLVICSWIAMYSAW